MVGRGAGPLLRGITRRPGNALVVLLVVLLVAAGLGALAYAEGAGRTSAAVRPSTSPSPAGSPIPTPGPVLAALSGSAALPTAAGLRRALVPALTSPGSGGHIGWAVADATTGTVLAGAAQQTFYTPASVTKTVTALAALAGPGGEHRITTRVVAGSTPGQVVIVGAGDPTLSLGARQAYPGGGRLDVLAKQVRTALADQPVTSVVLDDSAYSGPTYGPGWDPGLVQSNDVTPITAFMVDAGRVQPTSDVRTAHPDTDAAHAFARLLGASKVPVTLGSAPAGARQLGAVQSQPLSRIIEECLQVSDNVLAEALARQVAIWAGEPASFTGAAAAVRARLAALGLPSGQDGLVDGSGLSRQDRLTPTLLVSVMSAAAEGRPGGLRDLIAGLPVAGYSGTLGLRYRSGPSASAAGNVRAKTGSLSGVATLSGLVVDADGHLLAFALMANRVPAGAGYAADQVLDRVSTAVSRCGCR